MSGDDRQAQPIQERNAEIAEALPSGNGDVAMMTEFDFLTR